MVPPAPQGGAACGSNPSPRNPDQKLQPATATADEEPTFPPLPLQRRGPDMKATRPQQSHAPSFAELYTPKLLTVLREGYGLPQLRADAIAGLTVAIVALPLSMAIAIASGATPAQGSTPPSSAAFLSLPSADRASRLAVLPAPSSCSSPRPWRSTAWTD